MSSSDGSTDTRPTAVLSRGVRALLLSPIVVLFAAAIRLIIVGDYDTTTATTIAAAGGATGTLLGTIVPLLPSYLPVFAVLLAIFRRWTLFALAVIGTALISPAYETASDGWSCANLKLNSLYQNAAQGEWLQMWGTSRLGTLCAGVGVLIALFELAIPYRYFVNHLADSEFFRLILYLLLVVYVLAVAWICALSLLFVQVVYNVPLPRTAFDLPPTASEILRRPWLPLERISLSNGGTHLGYTISAKDGWFVVLSDPEREIIYIRASNVVDRATVSPQDQRNFPLPLVKPSGVSNVPLPDSRSGYCQSLPPSLR